MNRVFLLSMGFLMWAVLFTGCKTSKGLSSKKPAVEREADFLMTKLESQQVQPEWLSAKAKVSFDDGYQSMSGIASIKMRKDSLLWIAVRKLGFEVARVMITPDSVFMLDRLNNEYAAQELEYLAQQYHFPANLGLLQALLLGHPFLLTAEEMDADLVPPNYRLRTNGGYLKTILLMGSDDYLLQQIAIDDQKEKQSLRMDLSDYEPLSSDQKFSYFRNIELKSLDLGRIQVALKFSQVDTEGPLSFRFVIPDRYTRVD